MAHLKLTHNFPEIGKPVLENGFYASVHDLGNNRGVAISIDGVGSKLLVAQVANQLSPVGKDIVAVNVNDVLCVGAKPTVFIVYTERQNNTLDLESLVEGLMEGASEAGVAVTATKGSFHHVLPEMVKGANENAFELVGTCVGEVALNKVIDGREIKDGDVIIGYSSSGLHSNGYTLARKVLLGPGKFTLDSYVNSLGRTIGEELLLPTRIYVRPILATLKRTEGVTGLAHISGDGLLNLLRFNTSFSPEITDLPEAPPIFRLIQQLGEIPDEEMYKVFNMGIGFCAIAKPEAVAAVLQTAEEYNFQAQVIGKMAKRADKSVYLKQQNLVGIKNFVKVA